MKPDDMIPIELSAASARLLEQSGGDRIKQDADGKYVVKLKIDLLNAALAAAEREGKAAHEVLVDYLIHRRHEKPSR